MSQAAPHIPVLLAEVIDALAISPGETHVDGTFGAGGYSRAMTKAGARVIAFDRDPDAIAAGRAAGDEGLTLVQDRFSNMAHHLPDPVDGVGIESFSAKCKPVPYAERLIKEASKGLFARIIP